MTPDEEPRGRGQKRGEFANGCLSVKRICNPDGERGCVFQPALSPSGIGRQETARHDQTNSETLKQELEY